MRVPSGSSPHTRGLLPRVRRGGHGCRIIPAHAGFTGHAHHPPIMYEDHPRTRGVYHLWPRGGFVSGGSSPHTRGLLDAVPDGVLQGGIIPAHAGFTDGGRGVGCPRPDHPRTRGVYSRSIRSWASRRGSSPHTRGLRRPGPGRRPRSRDHPRTRGVYLRSAVGCTVSAGSSPHTRGLQLTTFVTRSIRRIIPAHAGFTRHSRFLQLTPRDHPRTRGVYAHEPTPVGDEAGSSPHTRGLPPLPARVCGGPGIIPAHAGFTLPGVSYALSTSDHPRTRGVYETPLGEYIHTSGSSPHTRGLQALVRRISAAQGIIPAHAGFTRSRPRRRGGGRDHPRTRGVY